MNNDEDDNISRLKFIGKIQKGDKINIKYMFVQPNNIFTRIIRSFYYCDNRNNTLAFLTETVKKCFDELITHIGNGTLFDMTIANNIIQDFDNCKSGLINLKDTYNDDVMFCCKIDKIIQDVDARLEEIKLNNKLSISSNNMELNNNSAKSLNNLSKKQLNNSMDSLSE
jgi:hypothetical protein